MCPFCEQRTLEPFHYVENPRPWRKGTRILCHGLLRCTNPQCRVRGWTRYLNRDLVAALNMRAIFEGHRAGGERPARFCRPSKKTPAQAAGQAAGQAAAEVVDEVSDEVSDEVLEDEPD